MPEKIGLFGGTFNPIHYGHLAAAEEVRERLKLDRILFIPSFLPPHKPDDVPSAAHRLAMVRIAIAGNPHFEPSDIEIMRGGRSYTIDTIETLRSACRNAELFFITGIDSFLDIRTWHAWERLLSLCAFVVLSRPGNRFADLTRLGFMAGAEKKLLAMDAGDLREVVVHDADRFVYVESIPLYDISSTGIRERLKSGESIKYLLPEQVETYIIENKLYV